MTLAPARATEVWLLATTLVVAVAGLIYELIAATVSSYLLGDSVRQFSFVIGIFLSAMGVGAWVSRFVTDPVAGFVRAQIGLGLIGGCAALVTFYAYATVGSVALPLYGALIAVGVLSGMEIPLLARILKDIGAGQFRFENVLSVDYLGALVASLAFPVLIVPHLSLVAAGLVFGLLNLAVAGGTLWLFRHRLGRATWGGWGLSTALVLGALAWSGPIAGALDARLYEDEIVLNTRSTYQQITVTRFQGRTRLFLDGAVQFDTGDEHRYHEPLVHPAMAQAPRRARVLVMGGGDGMAVREVLRWPDVEAVTLVDLDPDVTRLFRDRDDLAGLNGFALRDPRVEVVNADAFTWVRDTESAYDVAILDLPDPKNLSLSRLYTAEFYRLLAARLSAQGIVVTQAGSPMFAADAFWIVAETLGQEWSVTAYQSYVPSFGLWGFAMARPTGMVPRQAPYPSDLRHLTPQVWAASQVFDPDTGPRPVPVNTLSTHPLPRAYEAGWNAWFR
ncbi:polyamine aminopropyltransferase 1 [Jannaschia pagri]|uniref:Polyamine aminopropyltransferase n=1 Tax=Jannaschia pagri TaxID=2829797 RepID=A0ABQ4NGM1_9RHOB|nr:MULTISPECIES: polyamine aminopropyltransferase [unclassified Jannaschia]GIT90328.1 polyamine aminopropyltransferase 1 [Jannaschia sp. AI_61]GIT93566.1 polyamine aminopropyltransferase 1 [Jannaschia sp. AI_62]